MTKLGEEFVKCIKTKRHTLDDVEISCVLGLWSVRGNTKDAYRDAEHYFIQYKDSGEYSSIIGGESVIDKLIKSKE